jgi:predicted aspartyl protease
MAILDTGCEMSIVSSRLMDSTPLEVTTLRLYAANGKDIPLLGTMNIPIIIEGHHTMAKVVVSDVIDELILGVDWLTTQGCVWDFKKATLNIGEWQIPVCRRPAHSKARHIVVATEQTVPARSFKDIPVKMIWKDLSDRTPDWVSVPNQVRHCVVTARSFSSGIATEGFVRILNCGNSSHRLRAGETIGTAEPAVVAEEDQFQLPHELNEVGSESSESVPHHNGIDATLLEKGDDDEVKHVTSIVDSLPPDLTSEQRQQAVDFILAHGSSISKSEFDLGRTNLVQHRIDTGDHAPVKEALRRHILAYLPVINEHVDRMLEADVIEPAVTPWASNVVLIRKRNNSLRFCIDFRRLNAMTTKDSYPLPRVEDCLRSVGNDSF